MIYFIGDIHGEFEVLNKLLEKIPESATVIQVGDYGLWPGHPRKPKPRVNPIRPVHFIDGNHEYFPWLRRSRGLTEIRPNSIYIPRGTVLEIEGKRIGFLGGADSIDKAWRTAGIDWFPDERITHDDGMRLLDAVGDTPLDILVTHTPPVSVVDMLIARHGGAGSKSYPEFNGGARAVEALWEALGRPLNISGHMHPERVVRYGKCVVLPINGVVALPQLLEEAA